MDEVTVEDIAMVEAALNAPPDDLDYSELFEDPAPHYCPPEFIEFLSTHTAAEDPTFVLHPDD